VNDERDPWLFVRTWPPAASACRPPGFAYAGSARDLAEAARPWAGRSWVYKSVIELRRQGPER